MFPQVEEHQPSEVIAHDDDHEVKKKSQHFHKELIFEDSLSTGSLNSKSGVGISKLHPGGETSFSVLSPFHQKIKMVFILSTFRSTDQTFSAGCSFC